MDADVLCCMEAARRRAAFLALEEDELRLEVREAGPLLDCGC